MNRPARNLWTGKRTSHWVLTSGLFALAAGCSSRADFVQLQPGVAVSARSIDEYAEQHGLSRDEAKSQLAAQITTSESPEE